MKNWNQATVFGVVTLVVVLIVVGLLWGTYSNTFDSNGERIYFTATNERGVRITYRNGSAFGSPGMMMGTRLDCASCHGLDGRGGVHTMYMQVMDGPDIRWSVLAGEAEGEQDDGHVEAHADYDLETFRMAVVEGKHPDGERLSNDMPRWNLGEDDLADLAAFLKSPSLLKKGENEMFPGGFGMGGWWIIFPIIGLIVMLTMMFLMFGRGGFRPPWQDSSRDHRESRESETALEILKKRYAKGEITKEEYEEMKRDL